MSRYKKDSKLCKKQTLMCKIFPCHDLLHLLPLKITVKRSDYCTSPTCGLEYNLLSEVTEWSDRVTETFQRIWNFLKIVLKLVRGSRKFFKCPKPFQSNQTLQRLFRWSGIPSHFSPGGWTAQGSRSTRQTLLESCLDQLHCFLGSLMTSDCSILHCSIDEHKWRLSAWGR